MLQVYLPVAEISVNLLVMLGLGAAVGFLSGMFGVGGGFLLTPLLMFSGIPPAIAVATGANQIVASSVSGALAQWRRGNIDFRMGLVLIAGGVAGAIAGVLLVGLLNRLGHADVFISLVYVIFLGADRLADARREPPRHVADARRQARHHAQARRSHLDPRAAAQDALPALAPLYQRHSAADPRGHCRAARGGSRRRRRLHHRAGDDLSVAHADPCRHRHVAVSDHFRHRDRHRPLRGAESDARRPACFLARDRRGDRRPIRRQCRSEAEGRAPQASACASSCSRWRSGCWPACWCRPTISTALRHW